MSKINSGTTVYVSHCRAERKAIAFLKEANLNNNAIMSSQGWSSSSILVLDRQRDRQLNAIMSGTMAEVRWKKTIIRLT
jgi:hypothetical protein